MESSGESLQLFIKRHHAYGYFVIGTEREQRNTAIDTVLAENDPEPKQPVCFNSTGRDCVFLGTGLAIFRCITIVF